MCLAMAHWRCRRCMSLEGKSAEFSNVGICDNLKLSESETKPFKSSRYFQFSLRGVCCKIRELTNRPEKSKTKFIKSFCYD